MTHTIEATEDRTDELSDETKRVMYDRLVGIGGIRDLPVDDCVEDVVREMREDHDREYDVPTQTLVDAAYDIAAEAVTTRKEDNSANIAVNIAED